MVTLLNTIEDKFAREVCKSYGDKPEELLEILHAVNAKAGYVSEGAMRTIAYALNISRAEIHGVVTFYHDYKREAGAKHVIKICRAEACQAVGAMDLIAEAEKSFGVKLDAGGTDVALESTFCLGNCALGPAIMIDEQLYGRIDIARLKSLSAENQESANA